MGSSSRSIKAAATSASVAAIAVQALLQPAAAHVAIGNLDGPEIVALPVGGDCEVSLEDNDGDGFFVLKTCLGASTLRVH